MKRMVKENLIFCSLILILSLISLTVVLISCSGGGGGGSAPTGTVTTTITDPPVCLSPNGPFTSVWVTITRVRAHTSSDANSNDAGWVDLVDLRQNPRQIDLLNLSSTSCLLTQLGSTSGIPIGKYQQIRLYLLSNSPAGNENTPQNNQCDDGYNCVVLESAPASTEILLLSSEANTGIKIPPGQISGGGLTVLADQTVDLNIDFDACTSIIQQNDGQYRLKPTLRAAEVSVLNKSWISGRVIDQVTKDPIPNAIVMLETRDSGIGRVFAQVRTDPVGVFVFCPLPSGTTSYDVVAAARTATSTYNATVTLNVPVDKDMGDVPLVPESGGTLPATIKGQVTTSQNSADIQMSAMQSVPVTGGTLRVTIPVFTGSIASFSTADMTQTGGICSVGTKCADYILLVPASNPQYGVFSTAPKTSYTAPAGAPVTYSVEGQSSVVSGGVTQPYCSPSKLQVDGLVVTAGADTIRNFDFLGCQ